MNAPYQPNAESVGIEWVKTVPGVDPTLVGHSLPKDVSKWGKRGFITVASIGGDTNPNIALRGSILSLGFWLALPNSEKTPWGEAQAYAELVFNAFFDPTLFPLRVERDSYLPASLRTAYPMSEPRKRPGSTAGYAQVQFDARFVWSVAR